MYVCLSSVSIFSNRMGRLRYVEQELAKKRGKNIDAENQVENDVKRAEDELYKIPEHLKVSVCIFAYSVIFCFFVFNLPPPAHMHHLHSLPIASK